MALTIEDNRFRASELSSFKRYKNAVIMESTYLLDCAEYVYSRVNTVCCVEQIPFTFEFAENNIVLYVYLKNGSTLYYTTKDQSPEEYAERMSTCVSNSISTCYKLSTGSGDIADEIIKTITNMIDNPELVGVE